jgi:hypothetical protein
LITVYHTFATKHIEAVLTKSLAYGSGLMSDAEAHDYWKDFSTQVANDNPLDSMIYYSNTSSDIGTSTWGWTPLTTHTFDTGIVMVNLQSQRIGIIWAVDED